MKEFVKLNSNGVLVVEEGVKILNAEMLQNIDANSVKKVVLPKSLIEIKNGIFKYYHSLEEVEFNGGTKIIGNDCFSHCWQLAKANLPETLEEVGESSFLQCPRLRDLVLPQSLKLVKKDSFKECGIRKVFIPKNLTSIGTGAFFSKTLEDINVDKENSAYADLNCSILFKKSTQEVILGCGNSKLNEQVQIIGEKAFERCNLIEEINFPSSLREIKEKAFSGSGLKRVFLPKTLIRCEDKIFESCANLKEIKIEKGFKRLGVEMFAYCDNIHEISFPKGIEIGIRAFIDCVLERVEMPYDVFLDYGNQDVANASNIIVKFNDCEVNISNIERYSHSRNGMIFKLNNNQLIFADCEGNSVNEQLLVVYKKANKQNDAFDENKLRLVPEIWEWRNERYLPHIVIVEHMPLKDIQKFYKDNNAKNWFEILKAYARLYPNLEIDDISREVLFKMAYSLGVFSENGKQSEFAKKYIIENLIPIANKKRIEKLFIGLNTFENVYNQSFADFFVKYFDAKDFKSETEIPFYLMGLDKKQKVLVAEVNDGKGIDENSANFFSLCYNNFNNFSKLYSAKKVKSRLIKERITPALIAGIFKKISYVNVQEDARELSEICALYAFSQEDFEKIQEWYLRGKAIKETDKSIFVYPDEEDLMVKYELLTKNNPVIPILGILTNCCQKLGDLGESCLEYGMTKPNSEFLKFELNGELFGQCWLWYDDQHRQVTIDNIELSRKMENKIKKDGELQTAFKDCLNRFSFNAFLAMREKGIPVEKITMGLGHNFFKEYLKQNYDLILQPQKLSGYVGYTDASKQVMIFDVKEVTQKQLSPLKKEEKERTN